MKRIFLSFFISFLLLTGTFPVSAETNVANLEIKLSNYVAGEKTNYLFTLSPVSIPITTNEWITLIAPDELYIPSDIELEDVTVNGFQHPLEVKVQANQTVHLLIAPTEEESLSLYFEKTGQFRNPPHETPITFSLIWEKRSMLVTSDEIRFYKPSNSIKASFSLKEARPGWFDKPVTISLESKLAEDIYFRINQGKEMLYSEPVLFENGRYDFEVKGLRATGVREESLHIPVCVDSNPPNVKMVSPKDNFITNQSSYPIVFSIQDLSTVGFMIQQQTFTIVPSGAPVELTVPVTLQDGENKIEWKAMDELGLISVGDFSINLDTTPPALTVFSPRKGDIICGEHVEITGKSEPGSQLFLGEKSIPLDVYGNFSMLLVPTKGKNQIELWCFDPAGNETRLQIQFEYYPGKLVEIWIDQETATLDGKEIPITPPPKLDPESGEIYIPLRFIPSVLDYKLEWNGTEGQAVLTRKDVQILIKPNESRIRIQAGEETETISLDHSPRLMNQVLMIPSEFLKKILGADLLYSFEEMRLLINFCDRSE